MPIELVRIERTPNPNARKFVLRVDAPMPIRSYFNPAQVPPADPLGSALFAIEGVTNVLIHESFVSLCKSPASSWRTIESHARRALYDA